MGFTADLQSAFLQAVFQQLTTLVMQELILVFGLRKEVDNLKDVHSTIVAFLRDADERQQTNAAVKNWLDQLRDIAYDINDTLDEFATEAKRRQLVQLAEVRNSLSFLNPKRAIFRVEMAHRIKELTQRLDKTGKLRITLGLRERDLVWRGEEMCQLPSLRELVFKNCPDLRRLTHRLPFLRKLVIEGSPRLLSLPRFPCLHSLDLKASGDWIWESCPNLSSLSCLTISQLPTMTVPLGKVRCLASLRRLEFCHCDQLIYLPDDWLPASLTYIGIRHCHQFRALPARLKDLEALEEMEIEDCPQLSTLPQQLPKALQYLSISDCLKVSLLCLQGRREIAGISSVWINRQQVVSSQPHYARHHR